MAARVGAACGIVDVVGEEDLLEQQGVGEEDLLSGLILLYSMTVTFSTNPIWAHRTKRVMMAALLR